MASRLPVEVVIPVRWARPLDEQRADVEEMGACLTSLLPLADVTVVDASRADLVIAHRAAWHPGIRVMTQDRRAGDDGNVVGALSGIAAEVPAGVPRPLGEDVLRTHHDRVRVVWSSGPGNWSSTTSTCARSPWSARTGAD